MEKSSKRGKIPQSDWPSIMARYEAGETLASIARTYDCSPPAISYVVSRSRMRNAGAEPAAKPPSPTEPQLVKSSVVDAAAAAPPQPPANGSGGNGAAVPDANLLGAALRPAATASGNGNGHGDQRRTLH